MSTEHRNNGDTMPPWAPSGGKGKAKEMEEQADERIVEQAAERARRREAERLERERQRWEDDEEKNQCSLEVLMHYLDVETKLMTAKLESLQHQRERACALSQDVVVQTLDPAGEAELADLLHGSSPLADEVPDEPNDESTSDEDEYKAPEDGGKKRGHAEKSSGRKETARPEKKRRRTDTKKRTETEDAELARLDEREEWITGEEMSPSPAEQPHEGVLILPAPEAEMYDSAGESKLPSDAGDRRPPSSYGSGSGAASAPG
ncbi:hypothetical protein C8R45DRAFT_946095 [Mycena sanguinolenta]|nr:hypothetical protein C8R45DRAFT_946095 [Mycena sanguinolenta]